MNWSFLCQFLLLFIITVLENISHANARLLHVWNGNSPVVVCATKCNGSIHDTNLPGFLEFFRGKLLDQFVDLGDGFLKPVHHVLGCYLQLVNQSIDLVNEKNRLDLLLECLTDNSLSLRHWSFNSTSENETTVNSTHSTSNVATKVNVTWCVDEVDQVVYFINSVYH